MSAATYTPRHGMTTASVAARWETDLTRCIGLLTDWIADGTAAQQAIALTLLDWVNAGALDRAVA